MSKYEIGKSKARDEAIDWQCTLIEEDRDMSFGELAEVGAYFHKIGKRFGLLREFRENGIPC